MTSFNAAVAAGLTALCVLPSRTVDVVAALSLLALASVATRLALKVGSYSLTADSLVLLVAAIAMPSVAPFIALCVMSAPARSLHLRFANTAFFVAATASAGLVAQAVGGEGVRSAILTSALCTMVFFTVNIVLFALSSSARSEMTLGQALRVYLSFAASTTVVTVPLVAAISLAYQATGAWILPVIFLPVAGMQYFSTLYRDKVALTEDLAKANLQFAAAMVRALDARDAYTAGHSAAVAVYTRDIARETGCSEVMVRQAHLAGLLHDIGKIGIPGQILNKQSPLDDEEFEKMKEHAAIGAGILGEVDSYGEMALLVRSHHERHDGRGYPDRLEGELIPAISRMISVADTYSAMTTDRPYRAGLDPQMAIEEIGKAGGSQLDPMYSEAFLRILAREDDAYRRGKQTDFEVEVAKHQALGPDEQEVLVSKSSVGPVPGDRAACPDEAGTEPQGPPAQTTRQAA